MPKLDDLSTKLFCLKSHYANRQYWKAGDKAIRGQLGDEYVPDRWKIMSVPEPPQPKKKKVKKVEEEIVITTEE